MRSKTERRIFLVGVGLTVFALVIWGRLFFLQVVSRDYYESLAERQHASSFDLEARRGNIYFREKDGSLLSAAGTKSGFLLYVDPRKIEDPERVYKKLALVVPVIEREDFLRRASKKDDPYEVVGHRLDADAASRIKELYLPGVGVLGEEWRFYPGRELAAHVLGFVGYEGSKETGRYGIEYGQERILKGETSRLEGRTTLGGIFLDWGRKIFRIPRSGADIVLTIEPQLQIFLEKELTKIVERWNGERAGAIIMDPKTGRILAMAARPTFDPNRYNQSESLNVFVNPLVEHVYELGSVFKALTMAAGLDTGRITDKTTYLDQGFVVVGRTHIENYDGKGRGVVDMQTVLSESLNTGAVFVMRRVGKTEFRDYFENFGLGDKTDIELPGEVLGKLSNLLSSYEIDYATVAFGQGIAVTPLAFLRAVSALANQGKLVRPFIIDRIIIDGAPDIVTKPEIGRQVVSRETAEEVTRMLTRVVDEALLGGVLKKEHYSIAAKTGTAQIPSTDRRGYSAGLLHSFFGYAPSYDAEFAVFLFLVRPQGERYASRTLARPFMDIIEFLLSYYQVAPDR
ncbi:penicillin-binding protein 2 [Patescibacteria group bacterium]|nr:penicillin-binding protein 2 [Patescibacteria group bacterium]